MRVSEREPGDIAELDRRAKSQRNALQRDRLRAVLLALEGEEAVAAIAKTLSRSRRSVQDWVYAYRDGGIDQLKPKPRPGRPTKLPRDREAELKARLDAAARPSDGVCTLRGKDVVTILEREFGVKYSLDGADAPARTPGLLLPEPASVAREVGPGRHRQLQEPSPLFVDAVRDAITSGVSLRYASVPAASRAS